VPLTLLAFADYDLVGGVSLIEHDLPHRGDLADKSPWVAGAYVIPARRNSGIGTMLLTRVAEEATRLGIERIYLYTSSAEALYLRLGWRLEPESLCEGETLAIMSLALRQPRD
jgi:GNAT superfamily N-acetyltransferase